MIVRRFLFPFEFVAVFVAFRFGLEVAHSFIWHFTLQNNNTDVYLVQQTSANRFVPAIVIALVVAYIFIALDYVLNSRSDPCGRTTHQRLLKYGTRGGLIAIVFWLVWNFCVMLPLFNYFQHRRYHAYGPQMEWLNIASIGQCVVLGGLVLWALGCSLKHPTNLKS